MIDISLAGLIGASAGIVVAALVYGRLIESIERWLKSSRPPEEKNAEEEAAVLRRLVLAVDIFVFAGLGYWIGSELADRFV